VGRAAVVTVVAGMVVGSSAKSFVPPPQAVTISATTTATRIGRIMNLFSSRVTLRHASDAGVTLICTESMPVTLGTVDGSVVPAAGTWIIDGSHTSAEFVARHLMVTKIRGGFGTVTGTINVA
jgi:hypothetical protein